MVPVLVDCDHLPWWAIGHLRPSPRGTRCRAHDQPPNVHTDDPAFAYRSVNDNGFTDAGCVASERRGVASAPLSSDSGRRSPRSGAYKKAGLPVHDLVCRDFTAERSDQLRLTDITEHPVDLSHPALQHPILDLPRQSLHGAPERSARTVRAFCGAGFLIGHPIPALGSGPSTRVHPNVKPGRQVGGKSRCFS